MLFLTKDLTPLVPFRVNPRSATPLAYAEWSDDHPLGAEVVKITHDFEEEKNLKTKFSMFRMFSKSRDPSQHFIETREPGSDSSLLSDQ